MLGIQTFCRFLLSLPPLPTHSLPKTCCLQVTCVGGIRCVLQQRDAYANAVPVFGPAAINGPFCKPRSEWICIDPFEYVWTALTYGRMQAVMEEDDYLVLRWVGKVGKRRDEYIQNNLSLFRSPPPGRDYRGVSAQSTSLAGPTSDSWRGLCWKGPTGYFQPYKPHLTHKNDNEPGN